MQFVRWFLGRIILTLDFITRPKSIMRNKDEQTEVDAQTEKLSLYQFNACPFCVKVRRHLKKHALNIELRDAKNNRSYKKELMQKGGQYKVPCLRIQNDSGDIKWLYESNDIIAYLTTDLALNAN